VSSSSSPPPAACPATANKTHWYIDVVVATNEALKMKKKRDLQNEAQDEASRLKHKMKQAD
jgi:hypothetical protein